MRTGVFIAGTQTTHPEEGSLEGAVKAAREHVCAGFALHACTTCVGTHGEEHPTMGRAILQVRGFGRRL